MDDKSLGVDEVPSCGIPRGIGSDSSSGLNIPNKYITYPCYGREYHVLYKWDMYSQISLIEVM